MQSFGLSSEEGGEVAVDEGGVDYEGVDGDYVFRHVKGADYRADEGVREVRHDGRC